MKIVNISGCTSDSLTIDDVETIDMDIKDVKEAIKKVIDKETDLGTIQSVLMDLVESRGEFEYLGHCDECGDWITKYTIEV